MTDAVWPDERAGWWRRTGALVLDSLCVTVPSAIVGALLFAVSSGLIQWGSPGLQWQTCTPVTSIQGTLDPPPPPNSNRAALCLSYSVAGQIARVLSVGRTTTSEGRTESVSRIYALRNSGVSGAYDLSWITWVALLLLLVGSEWRTGTTPGKWLLGVRVMAERDPGRRSVPLTQIATRYGIAIGGTLLPCAAALAVIFIPVGFVGRPSGRAWLGFTLLVVLSAAWQIWNAVRIARRRPTIYDYVARVEVVRVPKRLPAPDAPMIPSQAPP